MRAAEPISPIHGYFQITLALIVLTSLTLIAADGDISYLTGYIAAEDKPETIGSPFDAITGAQAFFDTPTGRFFFVTQSTDFEFRGANDVGTARVKSGNFASSIFSVVSPGGIASSQNFRFDVSGITNLFFRVQTRILQLTLTNPASSSLTVFPATATEFKVEVSPISQQNSLFYSWSIELEGTTLAQQATTNTFRWTPNTVGDPGKTRTVKVTVSERDNNDQLIGEVSYEWEVFVPASLLSGQVEISTPIDSSMQALGEVTFDPGTSYQLINNQETTEGLTYIWDIGKRLVPWGEIETDSSIGKVCAPLDSSESRCSTYLAKTNSDGSACTCLDEGSDVKIAYDAYNQYLVMDQFIYFDMATKIILPKDPNDVNAPDPDPVWTESFSYEDTCGDYVGDKRTCEGSLTIINEDGDSLRATTSFTLFEETNEVPVASFTVIADEIDKREGVEITFDASESNDPDGGSLNYFWDFDNDGNIDRSSSQASIDYAYTEAGTYSVVLTIRDDENTEVSTEPFTITIAEGEKPIALITHSFDSEPFKLPLGVETELGIGELNFMVGEETVESDAQIIKYVWDLNKRDEPWGAVTREEISGQVRQLVCKKADQSVACTVDQSFQWLGDLAPGAPCSCFTNLHPLPEHNIYPSSVLSTTSSDASIFISYGSANECKEFGEETDPRCEVTLTLVDNQGRTGQSSIVVELTRIKGDLTVDGITDENDAAALFETILGIMSYEGDGDCDDDGKVTIHDYILLADSVALPNSENQCGGGI